MIEGALLPIVQRLLKPEKLMGVLTGVDAPDAGMLKSAQLLNRVLSNPITRQLAQDYAERELERRGITKEKIEPMVKIANAALDTDYEGSVPGLLALAQDAAARVIEADGSPTIYGHITCPFCRQPHMVTSYKE